QSPLGPLAGHFLTRTIGQKSWRMSGSLSEFKGGRLPRMCHVIPKGINSGRQAHHIEKVPKPHDCPAPTSAARSWVLRVPEACGLRIALFNLRQDASDVGQLATCFNRWGVSKIVGLLPSFGAIAHGRRRNQT